MSSATGSTVPRRQLGRLLREQRERAGVSMKDAYEFMECSYQRLWRLESGEPGVTVRTTELRSLCDWYEVSPEMTSVLVDLAKAAKEQGWWQSYRDATVKWSELYFGLEAGASRIRKFSPTMVPGLLQSHAYIEAVYRAERPAVPEDKIAPRVKMKQERQRLMSRSFPPAPRLEVILSEAVLRMELAIPGAMQQQLFHLVEASKRPNVSVRVLPLAAGLHPASMSGDFVILEFPPLAGGKDAEPATVYSEGLTGALYLDKVEELAVYEEVWAELADIALDEGNSTEMITAILKSIGETRS
jgi:hypothetical protein